MRARTRILLPVRDRRNWPGHTIRRCDDSIAKQALQWMPRGHRGRERPIWKRDLEKEMWTAGYKSRAGGRWRRQHRTELGAAKNFLRTCVKPEVMARLHLSESSPHTNTTSGPRSTESLTTDDGWRPRERVDEVSRWMGDWADFDYAPPETVREEQAVESWWNTNATAEACARRLC